MPPATGRLTNMGKGKTTICIVHTDATLLQKMGNLMKSAGIRVESYEMPSEFLQRSSSERPRCLILGVQLPEMDGLELQRKLHDRSETAPVIFVAHRGCDIPTAVEAMRQGAFDFMEAPVIELNLLRAVRAALAVDGH